MREKQQILLKNLEAIKNSFTSLDDRFKALNVKENEALARHNANRLDFEQLANEVNELRLSSYKQLTEFHSTVKDNTNQEEWGKIMKQFNKDLGLTPR